MSKIVEKTLTFAESTSPDRVGYRLYYEEAPAEVSYDNSPFINIPLTPIDGNIVVKLHEVPEFSEFDGVYNIGVSTVDDNGNESDFSKAENVSLDLFPPLKPGELILT